MKKQNWVFGGGGYSVIKDKQISTHRVYKKNYYKHYNSYLVLKFKIDNIETPTVFLPDSHVELLEDTIIDGQKRGPLTQFQFDSVGIHEIMFKWLDNSTIKNGSFMNNKELIEVVQLPKETLTITDSSFSGCSNLRKINIRNGKLETIMNGSFSGCYALEELKLPETLKRFYNGIFGGCNKIKELVFYNNIENLLIYGLSGLEKIVFPGSIKTIYSGNQLYELPNLKEVVLQEGIEEIDASVFCRNPKLSKIQFPSTLKKLGYNAFQGCASLEEIILPDSVEEVLDHCFSNCESLRKLVFPKNLKKLGYSVFYDCPSLEHLVFPGGNIKSFEYAQTYYDSKKPNKVKHLVIPEGITTLNSAFQNWVYLETVQFPNTLETFYNTSFYGCVNLQEVILPDSVTSVSQGSFGNCVNIKKAVLSKNLEEVPYYMLSSTALEELIIPEGIKILRGVAFEKCSNLKEVTLPATLTTIEHGVFNDCISLEKIVCRGNTPPNINITNSDKAFENVKTNGVLYVPVGTEEAYSAWIALEENGLSNWTIQELSQE